MRCFLRLSVALVVASALLALTGCDALLGISDPSVVEPTSLDHDASSAPRDGSHDVNAPDSKGSGPPIADARAPSDGGTVRIDAVAPAEPDAGSRVVYVASTGAPSDPCGTRTAPCATISLGLAAAAQMTGAGTVEVLVAAGVYNESLSLVGGVSVKGGFSPTFTSTVAAGLDAGTVVRGTTSPTVAGTNLERAVVLRNLTFLSGAAAEAGASTYGVFLTSSESAGGAQVTLDGVFVETGAGGTGVVGLSGSNGSGPPPSCPLSGTGGAGDVGAPPPMAGSFSLQGYLPAVAGTGGIGATGPTGPVGPAECMSAIKSCAEVGTTCEATATIVVCAPTSAGGCGGGGGHGGTGGGGGGSSVAVFAWNVPLLVQGGLLASGHGGTGGAGGPGGDGGPGAPPPEPGMASYIGACFSPAPGVCVGESSELVAPPGGAGVTGGVGGSGGQGGGGSSYCIYSGGSPPPSLTNVTFQVGLPGTGSIAGSAATVGSSP